MIGTGATIRTIRKSTASRKEGVSLATCDNVESCDHDAGQAEEAEDEAWLPEAVRIPRPARSRFEQSGAEEQALLTEGCRPGLERLGYSL